MLPLHTTYHSDVIGCFGVRVREASVYGWRQTAESALEPPRGPQTTLYWLTLPFMTKMQWLTTNPPPQPPSQYDSNATIPLTHPLENAKELLIPRQKSPFMPSTFPLIKVTTAHFHMVSAPNSMTNTICLFPRVWKVQILFSQFKW
jgi:hypothetical protein